MVAAFFIWYSYGLENSYYWFRVYSVINIE